MHIRYHSLHNCEEFQKVMVVWKTPCQKIGVGSGSRNKGQFGNRTVKRQSQAASAKLLGIAPSGFPSTFQEKSDTDEFG